MATSADDVRIKIGSYLELCPKWLGGRFPDEVPSRLQGMVTGAEWQLTRQTVVDAYATYHHNHGRWLQLGFMGTFIVAIIVGAIFYPVIILLVWALLAIALVLYIPHDPLRKVYFPEAQATLNRDVYGGALKKISRTRNGIFLTINIGVFEQHLAARAASAPPADADVESSKAATALAMPIDLESGVGKHALL